VRYRTLPRPSRARVLRVGTKPLVALVLAGLLASVLSSCSTSPAVAIVNGQAITEAQLDEELGQWSSDPVYVKATDAAFYEQAAQEYQEGNQNPQLSTVAGIGSGPGIYGTVWASGQLSLMVVAVVVHEYLVRHHEAPSALQVTAAWDSEYANNPSEWQDLSPDARLTSATQDAERAVASGRLTGTSAAQAFYRSHESYFWSRLCVNSADEPTRKLALAVARSGMADPDRYCLTPEQLIEQPAAFRKQVGALAAGQTTVVADKQGYEVVQVRYRTEVACTGEIVNDVEVAAVLGGSEAVPQGLPKLIAILKASDVKVDPAYGVWVACQSTSPLVYPVLSSLPSCYSASGGS
jgi:hypothetical protein